MGISPWFKVEGKGVYHRGLEVFLSVQEVVIDGSVARHPTPGEDTATVFVYCWFNEADGPYEQIVVYESGLQDNLFLHDGVEYRPPRRSRWHQWRDHRAIRKAQQDF